MRASFAVMAMGLAALGSVVAAAAPAVTAGVGSPLHGRGRIAFSVTRDKTDAVTLRDLYGGAVTLVTLPPDDGQASSVVSLKWSPQAQKLAISDSRGRIFVVDADGHGLRQIASLPRREVSVEDWSPDGRSLALEANGPFVGGDDCPARAPGIYLVSVGGGQLRAVATHPKGAPPISTRPAVIDPIAWTPDGSRLLYGWTDFQKGDCRIQNSQTAVSTVRVNGSDSRVIAAQEWPINALSWSPDRRLVAIATACEADVPLAWATNSNLVLLTTWDGCEVRILNSKWQTQKSIDLYPSQAYADKPGTVLYAVSTTTGKATIRRALERGGPPFAGIGTLRDGSGIVAVADDPSKPFLISPNGTTPTPITPLAAPSGMTLGAVAAAR